MKKSTSLILCLTLILLSLCSCGNSQGLETMVIEDNECVVSVGEALHSSRITIPARIDGNKVVAIDESGFVAAENLEHIVIPRVVTFIGDSAFAGCRELKKVVIKGNKLNYLGEKAFYGCSSLVSIEIPEGLERIKPETFHGCISLTSITIPSTVTYIGERAFAACKSLTDIYIPESVSYLGKWAFSNCDSLETITYGGSRGDWTRMMSLNGAGTVDTSLDNVEIIFEK